jgi:hypothetical protein
MVLHDVHDRVVCVFQSPIALPLEHYGERGDGLRARLDYALHCVLVGKLAHVAAAILDDVDFVAVVNGLDGGKGNTGFRPEPGQHDLLPTGFLDRGNEVLVVPGVHGGAFDRRLLWEDSLDLRPEISAETLRFNRAEDDGHVENPSGFCEGHVVVDDRLAVEIRNAKEHLRFEIDQCNHAVVRGQQPLLTALRATIGLSHDFLLFNFGLTSDGEAIVLRDTETYHAQEPVGLGLTLYSAWIQGCQERIL